ncbi:hypothetical protein ACHAXN_003659 [Cyclotella atomus]
MNIKSLHRYAVKGLSGDSLQNIPFQPGDGTFQDDRRFALLFDTSGDTKFDVHDPNWLHKENFLCAFTAPELLASLDSEYRIDSTESSSSTNNIYSTTAIQRLLTIWDLELGRSSPPLLGPIDLSSQLGRDETAEFFTQLCRRRVVCVVANNDHCASRGNKILSNQHTHQFGNTSSGVKHNNGDTRTIHIVNENTVRQFSDAISHHGNSKRDLSLTATRFRPNIIVDNLEPWAEFDLVGKTIEVVPTSGNTSGAVDNPLRFRVVSRTVRCAGIGIDPLHPEQSTLDVPSLLIEHFPQHGPYLGVYAVVDDTSYGGSIAVGDSFRLL